MVRFGHRRAQTARQGHRPVRMIGAAGVAAACLVGSAVAALPASATGTVPTLYAASSATGSGSCADVLDACSLSTALGDVGPGGVIDLVTPGTTHYDGNFTVGTTGTSAGAPVTIQAAPGVTNATLDGQNAGRVLTIDSGVYVDLSGITITGGGGAGGIANNGGTVTVADATISGNNTGGGSGGGINNTGGTVAVTDSTISGNNTGGGSGGGINNTGGTVAVTDSTISGNYTGGGGFGGGINNAGGTVAVTDSTISGNNAVGGSGGGIANNGGSVTVTDSTISGNKAVGGSGGGINNGGGGTVSLAADVLATFGGVPSGGECSGGGFTDLGYNVADDNTCAFTSSTSISKSTAEDLGPLQNNGGPTQTIEPTARNPAIGLIPTGTKVTIGSSSLTLCPTTDQRGFASVPVAHCDAGSVQVASVLDAASSATGSGSCADVADACTLSTALGDVGPGGVIDLVIAGSSASYYYVGNFTVGTTGTSAGAPVTIQAAPGVTNATLDGQSAGRVLTIDSGVYVDLSGITITGGGIDGGIYNSGSVTVTDSTISGNKAGGGSGGGIYNSGSVTVTDSTISGNNAVGGFGGGIYNSGSVTVTDSTISGNKAVGGSGGGIANNTGGTVAVTDSTISGNNAGGGSGGGIYNSGSVTVTDSTISGNNAVGGIGGVRSIGIYNGGGTVSLAADVLATFGGVPSGGECSGGGFTDLGYNVADDTTCAFTSSTSIRNSMAEDLGPLQNNGGPTQTIEPTAGNPAIGLIPTGTKVTIGSSSLTLCPTTDQRGFASVPVAHCDAGSVQVTAQTISFTGPGSGTYGGTASLSATGGGSENPVVFSVGSSSGAGVCNVSGTNGSTVQFTGVGSCVIDANQAGNPNYLPAATAAQTIGVGQAAQSIKFTGPASGTVGGETTLSATGGTSGNPVVFSVGSSSGAGVCNVSGINGSTVHFSGPGSCVIDANQDGNTDYSAAPQVTQTVTVHVSSVAGGDHVAVMPSGAGYWVVGPNGIPSAFGSAAFYGSMGGKPLDAPVVGMAATPDGHGYWLVASDGGVFSFGDAAFYGSMGGKPLNAPVVGIAATPDGHGYWLVASDGGVFSFGDAAFYGSMGGKPLNAPVVGIAATPDGHGYWLVASDGGVFSFGDAAFYGSMGGKPLDAPVVGLFTTGGGTGYNLVNADGAPTAFGG